MELRAIHRLWRSWENPNKQMNRQQTHAETSVGTICAILVCSRKFLRFSKTRMKHNASYNIISQKHGNQGHFLASFANLKIKNENKKKIGCFFDSSMPKDDTSALERASTLFLSFWHFVFSIARESRISVPSPTQKEIQERKVVNSRL